MSGRWTMRTKPWVTQVAPGTWAADRNDARLLIMNMTKITSSVWWFDAHQSLKGTNQWATHSPRLGLPDAGRRAASLCEGKVCQQIRYQSGSVGSIQVRSIEVQHEHGWWRYIHLQQHYILSLLIHIAMTLSICCHNMLFLERSCECYSICCCSVSKFRQKTFNAPGKNFSFNVLVLNIMEAGESQFPLHGRSHGLRLRCRFGTHQCPLVVRPDCFYVINKRKHLVSSSFCFVCLVTIIISVFFFFFFFRCLWV